MEMTLIEKARAGRMAALASLDTRVERTENAVMLFDVDFVNKEEKPIIQFVSRRVEMPVERLAA